MMLRLGRSMAQRIAVVTVSSIAYRGQWPDTPSEWAWKAFAHSALVTGDFTGDGRTNIVAFAPEDDFDDVPFSEQDYDVYMLYRGLMGAWTTANVNSTVGGMRREAVRTDVDELTGDFNGDGRADFLFTAASAIEEVGLWLSQPDGSRVFKHPRLAGIGDWLQYMRRVVVGDFTGDGNDDLALLSRLAKPSFLVAASNGDGTFTVLLRGTTTRFAQWAADPKVKILVGNFNGDAYDDMLLFGKSCWDVPDGPCQEVIPIAYGGSGGFSGHDVPLASLNAGGARAYAMPSGPSPTGGTATGHTHPVVGDFNHDGTDDLVTFQAWPHGLIADHFIYEVGFVSLKGNSQFPLQSTFDTTLLDKVMAPGATPVAGDFDGNGHDDIAVVGEFGSSTIPLLLTTPTEATLVDAAPAGGATGGVNPLPALPGTLTKIPPVGGMTEGAAVYTLLSAGLGAAVQYRSDCNAVGTVAAAAPSTGSLVQPGTMVALTVHTQPATCTVPNVIGTLHEHAADVLRSAGFALADTVGSVLGTCDDAGSVAATTPAPGSVVAYGSVIGLTVRRLPPGGCEPADG